MKLRTGIVTASRVDLALILLPAVTWLEVSCMLALRGVPEEVAARVLTLPGARRHVRDSVIDRRESPLLPLKVPLPLSPASRAALPIIT